MFRNRENIAPILLKNSTNDAHLFDNNDNISLDAYQYGSPEIQKQLPLPSQSIKIPYREKAGRFITANQRNRELDYLRGKIQGKIELQQLHYQAKIQKMKQQNFINRQRLQQLLRASETNPALRDQYRIYNLNRPRLISHNNETKQKIEQASETNNSVYSARFQDKVYTKQQKIEQLLKQKQKILDEIDRIKIEGTQPVKLNRKIEVASSDSESSDSSDNLKKMKDRAKQRKSEMDYIYNRNNKTNRVATNSHFQKKQLKQEVLESDEKRDQYEWVRKVRKARKNNFQVQSDPSSSNSSSISEQKPERELDYILNRTDVQQTPLKTRTNKNSQPNQVTQRNSLPVGRHTSNRNPIGNTTKQVLQTYRGPTQRNQYLPKHQTIIQQQSKEQESRLAKPARVGGYSRQIHYIHPKLASQQRRDPTYMQMYDADRNRKSRYSNAPSARSESYYSNQSHQLKRHN